MRYVLHLWSFAIGLWFVSFLGFAVQAQETDEKSVSVEWFVNWIRNCELNSLGSGLSYFTRQSCTKLISLDRHQEALELWERAFVALKEKKGDAESHDLLRSALEMERLDLAERILAEADSQRNAMLDQIAVAKYIRGDKRALEDFPHGVAMMTFYDAIELGNAYIETNELEKLEELLTDLEITEENDPEDVAGILYKQIATRARDRGDLETAKQYMDKAYQVAGKQFYTGYTIDVVRRSINGNLVQDAKELAERAEAYRGHMARELLQWLIHELRNVGEYDLAQQIAQEHLESPEDRSRVMMSISKEQAQNGDYRRALELLRRLQDTESQDLVRLEVAKALHKLGKSRAAKELADFARNRMHPTDDYNTRYESLAEFEGMLGDSARLSKVIEATDDPYRRAIRFLHAFDGFLAAKSPTAR